MVIWTIIQIIQKGVGNNLFNNIIDLKNFELM